MLKIHENRGHLFSATLKDGSTLCLQSGEQTFIKKDLASESLLIAGSLGLITITEVPTEKKSTSIKNKEISGGADK